MAIATYCEVIAVACLTSVNASSGRLHESYQALQETLARYPGADRGLQSWLWTGLAEMAARAGLAQDAERHFKSALAADPADQYLLAAYADFLLDHGRAREAAALVQAHTRADGLLLRYALALKAQGSVKASQAVGELRARFDASRMRGDRVHLREEARFALHLDADPQRALELAKDNWACAEGASRRTDPARGGARREGQRRGARLASVARPVAPGGCAVNALARLAPNPDA